MLVELRAENYAVIDHAIASFGPGLNLLTGETGAGKSILVDALALLMGGKSSAEVVRHGADKAVVSCVFESTPGAEAILEENGIDSEGTEIILRREILSTGKGRVFVNNQPATVAVLKQLAPELALVHAQTETLSSFDQAQQRILLDRFAGISTDAVAEAHARWRAAHDKLNDLLQGEQDRLRMVDLWTYQRKEIEAARLEAGEDEALETEKRVLANAEKLYAAAMSAFDQLYEGGASAEAALRAALRNVEELARYDARFTESAQQLASARATVADIAASSARLRRRHQRLARAPGRNRRPPRPPRPPQAQIRQDRRRGHRFWRRRRPQARRSRRPRRNPQDPPRRSRSSRRSLSQSRLRPHRRAPGRRGQTRQTRRSPDQLARHEVRFQVAVTPRSADLRVGECRARL